MDTRARTDGDGSADEPAASPRSLPDLSRDPSQAPLATLAATLILGGFAYQAYQTTLQFGWWRGALIVVVASLTYRASKIG